MFILGLTGSVGMGKSTTARFFAEEGVPVHDADAVVHRLYEGEAVPVIEAAFPGTTAGGKVDRVKLGARVLDDLAGAAASWRQSSTRWCRKPSARFLAEAEAKGAPVAVLDIPLLFETGGEQRVDAVVVVSAPPEVQRARVLERPGMTERKARSHAGPADARRRKAAARRFRRGYVAGIRRRARAGAGDLARGCYNAEATH